LRSAPLESIQDCCAGKSSRRRDFPTPHVTTTEFLHPDQLLAAIVDSSEDAIISKDMHSIVMSWNSAAERLFGYTADEMIGVSIDRLFPKDRLQEEPEILRRIQLGERVSHFETVRVRKDGSLIEVSLTISPIRDASGKVVGASKIARDISEQRRSTRLLMEAHEALKRTDRMKAEFLAKLSHELRTPLTPVLMTVADILEGGIEDVAMREDLEMILRNMRTEARLIDDLLDVTRIEHNKMLLKKQWTDLHAVVREAVAICESQCRERGISPKLALTATRIWVDGDPARLLQVFWNLLSNAIKFTPERGEIEISSEDFSDCICVEVVDNGRGIDSSQLESMFKPFDQGSPETTSSHGGLGLGLAICKGVVELHDGVIRAESAGPGCGAIFSVELPGFHSPEKS